MITPEILSFLKDLAQNNNKAWFDANRPRYDSVRAQFVEFVADCIKELGKRMDLKDVEAKKCLFRINRDVRFSKNKDPYKLNFACSIGPGGKNDMMPSGIYIHIQPSESFVGMGMYELTPPQLKAVRQEIDFNLAKWKAIVHDPNFIKYFKEVAGERLKTNPKGYTADNEAIEWLRLKQFYVGHPLTEAILQSNDSAKHVGKVYDAATDFRQFLFDSQPD
jgi:uncharacterized protein (TIGR02453 family)